MRGEREPVGLSLVRALRSVPDFTPLDDRILLKILGASVNLFWRGGRTVFEQETPGDALYIVLRGAVGIVYRTEDDEVQIARVEQYGYFGELSLLRNADHSLGARTLEDTELIVVPKERFRELVESDEELGRYFRRVFEERASSYEGAYVIPARR
jgi:CRP-like cAMP-binding protein